MIIQVSKAWGNRYDEPAKISIGFLFNSEWRQARQDTVIHVAKRWEAESTNIKFVWMLPRRQYQACNVRISFTSPGGNRSRWNSEIGTDALDITDQSKPTMFLTWSDDYEFMKHNILHEFGHMLGAQHEHLSPEFPWRWNRGVIERHYRETIQNEIRRTGGTPRPGEDEIRRRANQRANQDLFTRLDVHDIRHSVFDDQSIMLYSIPEDWLQDDGIYPRRRALPRNYHLSYADGAILREVYGGRLQDLDADSSESSVDWDRD